MNRESISRKRLAEVGLAYLPAVAAIMAMRARFLFTPVTTDEGGYFGVARAWARGAVLYRDAWVDRPQGLLVTFRALDALGLGSPVGIRLMATAFCLLAVVACGDIAASLAGEKFGRTTPRVGERARWIAALAVGVLLSVPQIEGFIANGELMGGALGALALAAMLRAAWNRTSPHLWLCLVAGLAGGCAVSLKQSSFDAFVGALAALAVAWRRHRWSMPTALRAAGATAAGALMPVAAMAVHGAATGWDRWWSAVAGYRLSQRNTAAGADWDLLATTARIAAPVMMPIVAIVVVAGAVLLLGRRLSPGAIIVFKVWTAAGALAFFTGGHFHRHYWLIVMFPLGTALGVLLGRLRRPDLAAVALVAAMIAPLTMTAAAMTIDRTRVGTELSGDSRVDRNEVVADWLESRNAIDESVYALCASAGLYGLLTSDPPYPYLWFDGVRNFPGASARLVSLLNGNAAPRYVVQYQSPGRCDPSGRIEAALGAHYSQVAVVAGLPVYERSGR